MLIVNTNPSEVVISLAALNPDGSVKTDLTISNVRVYHLSGSSEVEDLVSTPLVQVGTTNIYRYIWEPTTLAAGNYIIEYTLVDSEAITTVMNEDLSVSSIASDVNTIKEIETGRWRMVSNQMILYKSDNVTEICRFNLLDADGVASLTNVFERVKV